MRGSRSGLRTTPTLTLSGEGSARKASVTPRIGSLGAGSTWPKSDDAIALAASSLGGSSAGRRAAEEAARESIAMPGRDRQGRGGGRRRQRGKRTGQESWGAKAVAVGFCHCPAPLVFALDSTTRLLVDRPGWPAATVRCCCGLRPLGAAALATCLKQTGQTMTPGRITSKRESRPFWPLPGCPPQPPSSLEMAKDI